jgi:two-component system, sensor histidine kinase and response regulator
MPEMDGYQATAKLRADPRTASLPIVAMTAHATIEERQRCLAAGMNDHVAKPIDPASLFDTVARFYEPAMRTRDSGQPAKRVVSADASPDDSMRLPTVAGLDIQNGLSRVGGNVGLYLKLLRQFVEQHAQSVEQIGNATAGGDAALAERLAHTLKGVAGNIGAASVQSVSGVLEKLIRNRAGAHELTEARQQVAAHLEPLVAALRTALQSATAGAPAPEPAGSPASPAESRKAAAGLIALLAELDPTASDFLATNRAAVRPLFSDDAWAQFERLVADYSFAEAQTELEAALQHFAAV